MVFSESLTLSTYYPAPFGSYDRLKLVPRSSLSLDPHCDDSNDLGTMYYDNGEDSGKVKGIYVCQEVSEDTLQWVFMSRPPALKMELPSSGKVVCVNAEGKFGGCVNNPSADGSCACQ